MREAAADLWALHAAGAAVAVTTSGAVGRDGRARLGRGCARQAGDRYPEFAAALGAALTAHGNHVALVLPRVKLASFPVEHDPLQVPDLRLVARSAGELVALADAQRWAEVALPRPGCGGGGLAWSEVRPLLAPILDDRFVLVTVASS